MLDYIFQVILFQASFYLVYEAFLKKETFFSHNRWFLFFGIVIASLLPLVEIPVYIPVETSIQDFLRLEARGMQDLMSQSIKNKIEETLNKKIGGTG